MRKFITGIVLAILSCTAAASTTGDVVGFSKYRKHTYAWLLTAEDSSRIKLGAKGVEYDGALDLELADMAAKVLWEYGQARRRLDADTISWLARALGTTHSKRYQALLETIAVHNPGKIANYAKNGLADLRKPGETFDPDAIQLGEIRESLLADAQAATATDASLFDLQSGVWIEDVFAKLGFPSDVTSIIRTRRVPYIGHVTFTNLLLTYEDKGSIEFEHNNGDWYATAIAPRSIRRESSSSADSTQSADDIAQGLLSLDPMLFRMSAIRAYRTSISDKSTLDAGAWRLQRDMKSTDGYVLDGLAYICRMIGRSGNARYHDLLVQVSKNAEQRKLRRYAETALTTIPDAGVEQYTGPERDDAGP